MSGAVRQLLAGGRWHFQHGPIDCIVHAEGETGVAAQCIERAWRRFGSVLDELSVELPALRSDLSAVRVAVTGGIARRMVAACRPHAAEGRFITAMAAVAGSVAEELIAAFDDRRITRAYVNNGGDIALHLIDGAVFDIGVATDLARSRSGAQPECAFGIDASSSVRGIATSGWRGRSFSLGIADSVTVLAASASVADAAATIVANAVDVDDVRIVRAKASAVRDDSDLGDRLVVRHVPPLAEPLVRLALARGAAQAEAQIAAGRIMAAVLALQGQRRVCGDGRAALALA